MASTALHFDGILETYVGSGGRWQWIQYLLIMAQNFATNVPFLLHIFSANTPMHRCLVPLCETTATAVYNGSLVEFAIPKNEDDESFLRQDQTFSKCQMFEAKPEASSCIQTSFNRTSPMDCESHVYDNKIFTSTIVTEFDLVCNESFKIKLISTMLMVGLTVGCLLGGPLGDKVGRRKSMVYALCILSPCVIIESFVPNFIMFAALRLIVFISIGILWVCVNSLILELFASHHRRLAFVLNAIMYSVSCAIMALVGYVVRDWRHLHLCVGIMVSVTVPVIFLFLKESMRWLILNGQEENAMEIMLSAARVNKNIDEINVEELRSKIKIMASSAKKSNESKLTIIQMFKPGYISITFIVLVLWISCLCCYYALALNVGSLAGDIFVNHAVSNLVDVPTTIMIFFTIDRIGRKGVIIPAQIALGVSCIAIGFTPKEEETIILVLFLIGKLSSSVALSMAWFYTAELFPTNLRTQAVAFCSIISRLFGTMSSFVPGLSVYWTPLPMVTLGVPALVSAALIVFLPETMGKELRDFAQDEEEENTDDTNYSKMEAPQVALENNAPQEKV